PPGEHERDHEEDLEQSLIDPPELERMAAHGRDAQRQPRTHHGRHDEQRDDQPEEREGAHLTSVSRVGIHCAALTGPSRRRETGRSPRGSRQSTSDPFHRRRHRPHKSAMKLALALYEGFTALDIIGPFQVLADAPGMEPVFVADRVGPVTDHTGAITLQAKQSFDDVPKPDILVIPGGMTTAKVLTGHPIVPWVRRAHATTT